MISEIFPNADQLVMKRLLGLQFPISRLASKYQQVYHQSEVSTRSFSLQELTVTFKLAFVVN